MTATENAAQSLQGQRHGSHRHTTQLVFLATVAIALLCLIFLHMPDSPATRPGSRPVAVQTRLSSRFGDERSQNQGPRPPASTPQQVSEEMEKKPVDISHACKQRLVKAYSSGAALTIKQQSHLVPISNSKAEGLLDEVLQSDSCSVSDASFNALITDGGMDASLVDAQAVSTLLARMAFMRAAKQIAATQLEDADASLLAQLLTAPLVPSVKALFYPSYNGTDGETQMLLPPLDLLDAGTCLSYGDKMFGCLPSAQIIGVMKGGTAELQGWLSQHPQLWRWQGPSASGAGEAHFFDSLPKHAEQAELLELMRKKMLPNYVDKGLSLSTVDLMKQRVTFEKTPKYISMSKSLVWAMHHVLPSSKLMLLLRNPTARAYSHYQHRCRQGTVARIRPDKRLPSYLSGAIFLTDKSNIISVKAKAVLNQLEELGLDDMLDHVHVEMVKYPCPAEGFDRLVRVGLQRNQEDLLADLLGGATDAGQSDEDDDDDTIIDDRDASQRRDVVSGDPKQLAVEEHQAQTLRSMLKRGLYHKQIASYLKLYQREQLFVVLTEELFHNFTLTIDRVQRFLKLPYFDYSPRVTVNENGYTVLEGLKSKSSKVRYDQMAAETKAALDEFFRPVISKLVSKGYITDEMSRMWLKGGHSEEQEEELIDEEDEGNE